MDTINLTPNKLTVVQRLYSASADFRSTVDNAIRAEADRVKQEADVLAAAVSEQETTQEQTPETTEQPKPKSKRSKTPTGRKRGRPKKNQTTNSNGSTASDKLSHKDAIVQVLKRHSKGMHKSDIKEALSKLKEENYDAPSDQVLLTVLHGMKKQDLIRAEGERGKLLYFLSK